MSTYAASAKQYAERVVSHEILTCEWVQKACKRQLDDLIRFKRKSSLYQFNPELLDRYGRPYRPADNLCAFIERLPHVKGPLASKMIVLEPWQVFILSTVFGWVKSDGKRRFRRSYIEVPRGNAKSTLSSAVGLYMLAADREGGAEVYSLATTRDQARIVFGDAQTMARLSPGFRNRFAVNVGAHNMHVLQTGSKFEALSAEGSTLDGLNIHFGCIDELHAHKTRTVYDVVETGTGKRDNSLLWVITTAGSNRSGICYEVRSFVTKLLNRVFEDDSQFGIIYGLDEGDDWAAKDSLIKANPNWGISVREEILVPLQAKAMQLPSAVNNFKTKHLNEWVNADTAWMDMRAWDACGDPTLDIEVIWAATTTFYDLSGPYSGSTAVLQIGAAGTTLSFRDTCCAPGTGPHTRCPAGTGRTSPHPRRGQDDLRHLHGQRDAAHQGRQDRGLAHQRTVPDPGCGQHGHGQQRHA